MSLQQSKIKRHRPGAKRTRSHGLFRRGDRLDMENAQNSFSLCRSECLKVVERSNDDGDDQFLIHDSYNAKDRERIFSFLHVG